MRSARINLLTIAFALSSAMAVSLLRAAESAPAAPAAAPEKIEFSRSTSTTPKVPRPGLKNEDRLKNYGNVQESAKPEFAPPVVPNTGVLPSRAAAKKLLEEWDRKKNWAVPSDNEKDSEDPLDKIDEPSDDDLTGPDKPKSVMDEFMTGGDPKKKNSGQPRSRDLDRDNDRRDNRFQVDSRDRELDRDRDDGRDDKNDRDDRDRDPDDNSDSNGLAAFNLKKFIREQNGMANFKDQQLPRAAQLFRSEIGNNAMSSAQLEKDRTERQARSAEFMQMLKPRTSTSFAAGDPVNAPDLTRREANPVTPRAFGSASESSSRSPFNGPSESPASRIQDNAMFGVTGPAASSISPSVSAPAPRPVDPTRRQIIIDAPRRIGF